MTINDGLVVMLCTGARGGMRSVVEGYQRDGLFDRWNVRLIETHVEGGYPRRLWTAVRALATFSSLLLRRKVRLVHCHVAMRGSFWRKAVFTSLAKAAGIPVILHLHGSDFAGFYDAQPNILRKLVARLLASADRLLVLSESWARFVGDISPSANVVVMPNYVVLPALPPAPQEDQVTFLFLGLLGHRKGIYDLLPAFDAVAATRPGIRLQVGGNGEVEETKAMIDSLGIASRVDLLGWVAGPAKEDLLEHASVFTLPSYNEGLPMSILEAMAWGKPVITTPVGGIPELVRDGIDGLIVAAGDVAGLGEALARLSDDGELRRRMGDSARRRVEDGYSRDAILPRIETIYAELTKPR